MEKDDRALGGELSLDRLAGLARLMNSFKEGMEKGERKPAVKAEGMTEFDLRLENPAIRTIKAAIPYMEERYRRGLGVMVKLIEIDKFLSEYQGIDAMKTEGNMAFLKSVVPGLPKENRRVGEMLIRLLEIREIAERGDI